MLGKAIKGNYLCAHAMDNNPLFDAIRKDPSFRGNAGPKH